MGRVGGDERRHALMELGLLLLCGATGMVVEGRSLEMTVQRRQYQGDE